MRDEPTGDDLERLAIHEAGHAVAAVALELTVYTASIRPNSEVILSRLSPMPPDSMLRWQLAGMAAESLAFGQINEEGAVSDRVKAKREAFTLTRSLESSDAMVKAAWPEVRQLLFDRWLAVERVALSFITYMGTLTGAELEQFLR